MGRVISDSLTIGELSGPSRQHDKPTARSVSWQVFGVTEDISVYLRKPLRGLEEALLEREMLLATTVPRWIDGRGPAVLIIEDEATVGLELSAIVGDLGCRALGPVSSAEAAIVIAHRHHPDLILMDVCLAGPSNGIEAANAILAQRPVPLVFITANTSLFDDADLGFAMETAVIEKPFSVAAVRFAVLAILGSRLATDTDIQLLASRLMADA